MIRHLIAGLRTSLKLIDMSDNLDKDSTIKLDIKSLVSIVIGIVSIAGVWFTLTAQLSQLQLDVIRMQDAVGMNSEFRIKWPRGELDCACSLFFSHNWIVSIECFIKTS